MTQEKIKELREAAEKAIAEQGPLKYTVHSDPSVKYKVHFEGVANPATVLELLDEREKFVEMIGGLAEELKVFLNVSYVHHFPEARDRLAKARKALGETK